MSKRQRLAGITHALRGVDQKIAERYFRNEEGATLVEAALSISIFLMVLIAVFAFSIAFYTYHRISDAACEGTRYAIVRGYTCSAYTSTTPCPATETDIANYVKSFGYPGLDPANNMTVTVTTSSASSGPNPTYTSCGEGTSCNAAGDEVQVTVTYQFPLSIPFWNQQTIDMSSSSSLVYAQ